MADNQILFSDHAPSQAADAANVPDTGQQPILGPVADSQSPTDATTLHDSAYSLTSSKMRSPDSDSIAHDLPRWSENVTSLDNPHLEGRATDKQSPAPLLRLLCSVEAMLRSIGAFRISTVRRTWSHVTDRPTSDTDAPSEPTWRTTFVRFGPLSGIFAMMAAVGTMIASLGVLVGSKGQAVAS